MGQALPRYQENRDTYVCCVCGKVRDDIAHNGAWHALEAYLARYGFREDDLTMSHTFCPLCFMHYGRILGLEHVGAFRF